MELNMSAFQKVLDRTPRQWLQYVQGRRQGQSLALEMTAITPCVFVLSTGRTGTKTVAALLNLSKGAFVYHEPTPKLYPLARKAYDHANHPLALEILEAAVLTARQDLWSYAAAAHLGYVETSPQVTFLAPVLLKLMPHARFIHLLRDPRSVVRSAMRRQWYAGHRNDPFRIVPRLETEWAALWQQLTPLQKNAWMWQETNAWITHFMSTSLPKAQQLQVHSEDIFRGRPEVLQQLFEFACLPMAPEHRISRILDKKLNAQRTGEFPHPDDWTEEMLRDLNEIAGVSARVLGYPLP